MPAVPTEVPTTASRPANTGPDQARRSWRQAFGATAGFRRLLWMRFATQWGDGVFQAALGGAVLFNPEREADPIAVAAGLAVMLIPYSVIGPFAGALLDRWDRRQVLLVASLLRAALVAAVALTVATGVGGVPLYAGALAVAGVSRFALSGLSAALPHVVDRKRLVAANTVATTLGAAFAAAGAASAIGLRALVGAGDTGSALTTSAAVLGSLVAAAVALGVRRGLLGPDHPVDVVRAATASGAGASTRGSHDTHSATQAWMGGSVPVPAGSTTSVLRAGGTVTLVVPDAARGDHAVHAVQAVQDGESGPCGPAAAPPPPPLHPATGNAQPAPAAQPRHTIVAVAHGLVVGARATAATPSVLASFLALAAHRLSFGVTTLLSLLLFRHAFADMGVIRAGFAGVGEAMVMAAAGLGTAAVLTPWLTRHWGRARTVRTALLVAGATQLALAATLSAPAVLAAAFVLGCGGQVIKLCADAGVQSEVDDDVRGQVFALYDAVFNVCYVLAVAAAAVLSPPNGWAPWLLGSAAALYLLGLAAHDTVLRRTPAAATAG